MKDQSGAARAHPPAPGASAPRWSRSRQVERVSPSTLLAAKAAFTVRRVGIGSDEPPDIGSTLISGAIRPRSGDLVLAEVTQVGHHRRLELRTGRRSRLHVGDRIIAAYADRYAPDQFEAEIPRDLGPSHLVASGGCVATMRSRHDGTRRPTAVQPLCLVGDSRGEPLNVEQFAIPHVASCDDRPPVIAVLGTSMNAGKTTTVTSLLRGLVQAGERPGGTKVTGTGSGADFWSMIDAGIHPVVDFTDAGMASTYKQPFARIETAMRDLVGYLASRATTAIVLEVADGLFQRETDHLIRTQLFRDTVDVVVFAAADAMGAVSGAARLVELGLPVAALSGSFTRSELAAREVAAHSAVPVYSKQELESASVARDLLVGRSLDLREQTPSRQVDVADAVPVS